MIKVLIVDDHELLRAGLELIFETAADIEVVGTAADGQDGLEKARALKPNLVLTDIRMPKLDGIALIKQLHIETPNLPVVVLTTFDDQKPIQQAMQLGAKGFLLKDADKDTILNVIRSVSKVKPLLNHASLARHLLPLHQNPRLTSHLENIRSSQKLQRVIAVKKSPLILGSANEPLNHT